MSILILSHRFSFLVCIQIVFITVLFIWIRAAFPRYRYDQLMRLTWGIFLPVALSILVYALISIILCDSEQKKEGWTWTDIGIAIGIGVGVAIGVGAIVYIIINYGGSGGGSGGSSGGSSAATAGNSGVSVNTGVNINTDVIPLNPVNFPLNPITFPLNPVNLHPSMDIIQTIPNEVAAEAIGIFTITAYAKMMIEQRQKRERTRIALEKSQEILTDVLQERQLALRERIENLEQKHEQIDFGFLHKISDLLNSLFLQVKKPISFVYNDVIWPFFENFYLKLARNLTKLCIEHPTASKLNKLLHKVFLDLNNRVKEILDNNNLLLSNEIDPSVQQLNIYKATWDIAELIYNLVDKYITFF